MRSVLPCLTALVLSSFVVACDPGAGGEDPPPSISDAGMPVAPDSGAVGASLPVTGGAANSGSGDMGVATPDPVATPGTGGATPAAGGTGGTPVTTMPDFPAPTLGYGASCTHNTRCESGVCLTDLGCSRLCDINTPNPCRAEKAFCLVLKNDLSACGRHLETGNDEDDAIVKVGDSVRRSVSRLDDQDLFTAKLDRLGVVFLGVQPSAGVDVALDIYNAVGEKIGSFDDAGLGGAEVAQTEVQQIGGWFLVVVRNVGNTTGSYEFAIERAAE